MTEEPKSPEQLLTTTVNRLNDANEKSKKALEDAVKKASDKSKKLMNLLSKDGYYIFTKKGENEFWDALRESSEEVGHALYMVLEIENKRRGIVTPSEAQNKTPTQPPQVLVQSTPAIPQLPGGMGGWFQSRTKAKSEEKIHKMYLKERQEQLKPKITTEQEVIDILEFGRQLIPELNRLQLYFQQCLDHLHVYDDEETKAFFYGELRIHLNKLSTITQSFCRTVAEYRKSVLDQATMELTKGMTEVVVAQMLAMTGGITPRFPFSRRLSHEKRET